MSVSVRILAAALLLGYATCLGAVLMQYDPTVAIGVVTGVEGWLGRLGAPAALLAPGRVEFVLNAAMVVPVALLAGLAFPRRPWASWVVYGFVASCAVELVQGLYLPPRSAQFEDVVANTLGAVTGALGVLVTRRVAGRRDDPRFA